MEQFFDYEVWMCVQQQNYGDLKIKKKKIKKIVGTQFHDNLEIDFWQEF